MSYDLAGLLDLWTAPPAPGTDAAAPFRERYADPVRINGAPVSAADLAARAALLRSAFERMERRVLEVSEAPGRVTVVFELGGRQTGPLPTSAGELPASGRELRVRVIDLLTVDERGLITEVWMTADELGALGAHGLVRLVGLEAVGG